MDFEGIQEERIRTILPLYKDANGSKERILTMLGKSVYSSGSGGDDDDDDDDHRHRHHHQWKSLGAMSGL
jgi:hypothetical protein